MKKINVSIEIVSSSQARLSSMSAPSRQAIYKVLARYYSRVRITIVDSVADLEALATRKPDLVLLGMKFVPELPTEDIDTAPLIWVADYLDSCGIAYTGSGAVAHELELNKPLAKQRALDELLSTAAFQVFHQNTDQDVKPATKLRFPLFVKPADRGGGLGVDSHSLVRNQAELRSKVLSIGTDLRSDALAEEYLSGREFSVAILKDEDSDSYKIMPIELVAPEDTNGNRMLSGTVKSADAERALYIADQNMRQEVMTLAISMFHALGARDYGRIDIRLDGQGKPHFLEANLLPSLISGYGSFPKACLLNEKISYETMILQIVRLGLARNVTIDAPVLMSTFDTGFLPLSA